MTSASPYHHGNLRQALLAAGQEILDRKGVAELSLRAIAAKAGVSHAAPAHHFGNLKGLLTALVTTAFTRFDAAMARERASADASPAEQMRAAGRGYVDFATKNPGLFRLMFSAVQIDMGDPDLGQAANRAYQQLAGISASAADVLGISGAAAREQIATLVWTAYHGYAHLLVEGRMRGAKAQDTPPPPDIAALLFGGWPAPAREINESNS